MSPTENLQISKKIVTKRLYSSNPPNFGSSGHDQTNEEESKENLEYNNSVEPTNSDCITSSEHIEETAKASASALSGITTTKLMRVLVTKKREFFHMRKRLINQQDALIELFATLKELNFRTGANAEEQLGEVRVLSVTQWPAHDLLLLIRENLTMPTDSELTSLLGFQVLERQREELHSVTQEVTSMVEEFMSRRVALVNFIRNKYKAGRPTFSKEWKHENLEIDNETEQLQKYAADIVANIRESVSRVMEFGKTAWIDREILVQKLERTNREALVLQNRIEENSKKHGNDTPDRVQSATSENLKRTEPEEFTRVRHDHEALKEQFNGMKNTLRGARARIVSLERQLKEARAESDNLHGKHHELEKFCRQRDSTNEAKSKKTMNTSKTEEKFIENLIRERNELASRLEEFQEQAQASESRTQAHIEEQRTPCDLLQAKLAVKDGRAEARVFELETRVKELESTLDSLRSYLAQLLKMESQAVNFIPPKEREPSERETEMWKELQELQKALVSAEKIAQQYREEKENLLQSVSDIAQSKGDNTAEGKMTIELLEREKKIIKLYKMIEEHKEREKVMQNTISRYEQQLMESRLEVKCLRNYNVYDKDLHLQDLEAEVIELQTKLTSLNRERKSLLSIATSRALMLERHERAAEHFVRVTRLRRDLTNLVAPQRTLRRRRDDKIAHSLSELCKSAAHQWSALQNTHTRMILLENTVMAQKEQLERESRVRTQMERRRELLERNLLKARKLSKSHMHIPILTGLTSQIQPSLQFIQEFIRINKRRVEENF